MNRILKQVEEWASGLFLLAILLDVLLQVIARELGAGIPVTEELARYLMIWMGFFGIAAATYRGGHMAVTFVHDRLPERLRRYLDHVNRVLFVLYAALMVVAGWNLTVLQTSTERRWSTANVPMWTVTIAVPVCMLLVVIAVIGTWNKKGREQR